MRLEESFLPYQHPKTQIFRDEKLEAPEWNTSQMMNFPYPRGIVLGFRPCWQYSPQTGLACSLLQECGIIPFNHSLLLRIGPSRLTVTGPNTARRIRQSSKNDRA